MIIFLVFTALYQISLNSAMAPLLHYLPKSLGAEEQRLLDADNGVHDGNDVGGSAKEAHVTNGTHEVAAPHRKPSVLSKWLRPDIYCDYETMRRMVPTNIAVQYDPLVEETAFFNPAITSATPLLWIPRDPMGISRQEVQDTSKVIPITDDGAYLDEKNNVCWDAEGGRPPIYEDKIYY